MKILALRGENICSLYESFEIDFTREPLASAGLFAISGPTGAGKSTLLDVVCLALYHTTPRLLSAPSRDASVPDAGQEISVSDPRNLLRKGAGFGFAEVDFVGLDQGRYRARWEVRRAKARENVRGNLKKVDVRLFSLDENKLISDSAQEVKQLNAAKIGLTFAEFTRSVLLAQNEFTSFLRASDNDKASILEKLTGAGIFSKIGTRVFQTSGRYAQKLDALNSLTEQAVVLSDEQRREKLEAVQRILARVQQHTRVQDLLKTEVQQQRRLSELQEQQLRIEEDLTLWRTQQPVWSERIQQAELSLLAAKENKSASSDALVRAREFDARLLAKSDECRHLEEQLRIKKENLKNTADDVLRIAQKIIQISACAKDIEQWKEQNNEVRPWAEHWPVVNASLNRAGSLLNNLVTRQKELDGTDRLSNENRRIQIQSDELLQSLQEDIIRKNIEIDKMSELVSSAKMTEIENRKSNAEKDIVRFKKLLLLKSAEQTDQAARIKLGQDVAQWEKNTAELVIFLQTCAGLIGEIEQKQVIQQKVKESIALKVSQNVEALRAGLVSGEECPVCGSKSHPLITHPAEHSLNELLQDAQRELSQTENKLQTLRKEQTQKTAEHSAVLMAVSQSMLRLETLERQIEKRREEWIQCSPEMEMSECDISQLQNNLSESEQRLQKFSKEFVIASQQSLRLQNLQMERGALMEKRNTLNEQMQVIMQKVSQLEERRAQLLNSLADSRRDMDSELNSIAAAVGHFDWHERWSVNSEQFVARIAQSVAQWQEKAKQADALHAEMTDMLAKQNTAEGTHRVFEAEVLKAQFEYEQKSIDLQTVEQQRRALLGGQKVEDVERLLEQRIAEASQKLQNLRDQSHALQLEGVAHQERFNSHAEQSAKIRSESQQRLKLIVSESSRLDLFLDNVKPDDALNLHQRAFDELEAQHITLRSELEADRRAQLELRDLFRQREECEALHIRWKRLSDLIGCAQGNRFRKEAQRFTLEVLLAHANYHLESFAPRYRLLNQSDTLNVLVEDLDAGGELRSVYSLSGGESFLVSLALAMGLSSLSSEQVHVESLFIDEGFGSLDAESLRMALNALDALQSQGRKVGVISHVGDMAERIGVQIQVMPQGQGRSRVIAP